MIAEAKNIVKPTLIHDIVRTVGPLFGQVNREVHPGGFVGIFLNQQKSPLQIVQVGRLNVSFDRKENLRDEAIHRALRLLSHPTHISSAQSGCPGAIRTRDYIFSMEGLPMPFHNEHALLCVALQTGALDPFELRQIAQISNNELSLRLLNSIAIT